MTIIDLVRNEGGPRLLAWRYPNRQLSTWTQLLVGEGEAAVLFNDRRPADLFVAGRYTLETANLPLLGGIVSLPFGGHSPFEAEVWYVAVNEMPDIRWGTAEPVQLTGGRGATRQSLKGHGQFGVKISDPVLFLTLLCRNLSEFGGRSLTERFHVPIMQSIRDGVGELMGLGGRSWQGNLAELSALIKLNLSPELARYGIELTSFYIARLDILEDDL